MQDFVEFRNKNKDTGVEAEVEIETDHRGDIHVIGTINQREILSIQEDNTQEIEIEHPKAQMVGEEEEAKIDKATEAMIEMIRQDTETTETTEMVDVVIEMKGQEIETEIMEET